MPTHSPVSQQLGIRDSLSVVTSTADVNSDSRKAWYLLSLLLSLGRPVPLLQLSSHCAPFRATPDLIRRLCSVPNSPIALTYLHGEDHINGGYVNVSMLGSLWIRTLISNKLTLSGNIPLIAEMEDEDLEAGRPFKRFRAACLEAPFSTVENVSWDGRSVSDFMKSLLNNKVLITECFTKTVVSRLEYRLEDMERKLTSAAIVEGEEQISVTSAEGIDCQTVNMCTHEAEFYTRTNDDAEICVREVHDSAIIPMEVQSANDLLDTTKTLVSRLDYRVEDMEHMENELISAAIVEEEEQKPVTAAEAIGESCFQTVNMCTHGTEFYTRTNNNAEICGREVLDSAIIPMEIQSANDLLDTTKQLDVETLCIMDDKDIGFGGIQVESGGNNAAVKIGSPGLSNENGCEEKKVQPSSKKGRVPTNANNQNESKRQGFSDAERHLSKSSPKTSIANRYGMSSRHKALYESFDGTKKHSPVQGNQQQGLDHKRTCIPRSSKRKHDDMERREGKTDLPVSSYDQVEPKGLPSFESYIVEEEEGSGGYGIVYRARKKDDGTTVAIKCPHEKAHKQHVINERRMLEQFGGRNSIIRYEGCIKSEASECFVLEHVEHDRPEVLKREIDLVQLRWYGYCLFRALSSLHKQGIVHRDVKPGNFLFSRKANKGYLIDFNLALDLQQKYGTTKKMKVANDKNLSDVMLQKTKSFPPAKVGRIQNSKSLDIVSREESKGSKKTLEPRNSKKKAGSSLKAQNDMRQWNVTQSQGAEGSGITSVKDVTSTRTPSAERVREPLPVHGRKGLLKLLQDAMHSPNHEASSVPTSVRKRVAAPPSKVDGKHIYVTPMPLQPSSTTITVTGLTNSKDATLKKEGPCVGTKGFRAPEVLLRSLYQGPKVDSWSAGVTLLYLIIGTTPFHGEPEQNIKEIAELRGSEDLWEVAKLHDRESSFPPDLYTSESLPSLSLREWCKINTKKSDFLNQMPASLMDLVDKCLTVNPRLRISAEDALNHEFFSPINEILKKHKLARQGPNKHSGSRPALHRQSSTKPLAVFDQQP